MSTCVNIIAEKETFKNEIQNKNGFQLRESVDESWQAMETAIYESAKSTYGVLKTAQKDWVREYASYPLPLYEIKKESILADMKNASRESKDYLRTAKSILQCEERRCTNEYWIILCKEVQAASDRRDTKTMHSLTKTALDHAITQLAKLKTEDGEPMEHPAEHLERWVEHYSKLYAQDLPEHPGMEAVLPSFGVYAELDDAPTEEELSEAISALSNGKAPGEDGFPAEIFKENKDFFLLQLHALLLQHWWQCKIPHKMRDTNIATLYQNKGDYGDCNNCRGISLLSVAGKIFARVLKRLQRLADRILPKTQSGFWGWSISD